MMRRGLRECRRVGGRCREDERTCGRKGSMRMSVVGIRARRRARAGGVLRVRAMEVLWRVRRSEVGGLRGGVSGGWGKEEGGGCE